VGARRGQACGSAAHTLRWDGAVSCPCMLLVGLQSYDPKRKKPPPPPPPSISRARWSLEVRSATWRMKRAGVSTPAVRAGRGAVLLNAQGHWEVMKQD